jgi:chemotaxis protein MotB
MARKKKHEDHVSHEAWAIPYGDLVTLLLAFFVVMYAMSSVNEGKYRILSDSLVAAFRAAPKSLEPIQVGEPSKARQDAQTDRPRTLVPLEAESIGEDLGDTGDDGAPSDLPLEYLRETEIDPEELAAAAALIEHLTKAIAEQLSELVDQDLVRLRRDRFWLEVEINTSVLFATGSAEVSAVSRPVLERISQVLANTGVRVQVEGHTDVVPIQTEVYPSNWELSAARAANVVRLFAEQGMAPETMAAVGFGQHRPVADNDTLEGRNRNRRVVIVVMAHRDDMIRETWAGPDEPTVPAEAPLPQVTAR